MFDGVGEDLGAAFAVGTGVLLGGDGILFPQLLGTPAGIVGNLQQATGTPL